MVPSAVRSERKINDREEVARICERRFIAAASFVMTASNEDFVQLRKLSKATDDELRNRSTGEG